MQGTEEHRETCHGEEKAPVLPLHGGGASIDIRVSVFCGVEVNDEASIDSEVNDNAQVPGGASTQAQQQKCRFNFFRKAFMIMITQFVKYKGYPSGPFSTGDIKFLIPCVPLIFSDLACSFFAKMPTKWGNALVYLSASLLVVTASIMFLSFNKYYGFALFVLPLPIVVAAALQKLCKNGRTNNQADDQDVHSDDEVFYVQQFDSIFDSASDTVLLINWGSIAARINLTGPVTVAGLFSFSTQVLGIYLMMITTVRTPSLTPHARYLAILLRGLCLITVMAAAKTHLESASGDDSHA